MISQHELQEVVTDSLKKLGLTEQVTQLYVLSLKLGPTSIAILAKHLSISRPQAYKLISELETHGLADFSGRKKFARTFMVESPSKLQELLKRQQEAISQTDQRLSWVMPDLLAAYQQGELPTTVRVLQGREQYLKIFFQCVVEAAHKEIHILGSAKDFITFTTWAEDRRWINERVRLNVFLKALLFPSDDTQTLAETDHKELRETRLLKNLAPFSPLIMIYANKTILWQPHAPMAVLMEDQYLTAMYESLFQHLWETHKPSLL